MGIFFLFALGYSSLEVKQHRIFSGYFPWIQGLHILLDYLIDLEEDRENGDLNFVAFYPHQEARDLALRRFAAESKRLAKELPYPRFHSTVVDGLIALYGSDPKVHLQNQERIVRQMAATPKNILWLNLCKGLRSLGIV